MGAVRRAFGSLLAVSARHASGSVSWDAAPRIGTRLASLRTVDARWYRHLGAITAPSVPGGGGPSGYAPPAARTSRRATRMHATSWASASDHWRGLSTVAGDDAPDDSDPDDADDDDDDDEAEAAFAAVDDDDIAAYDDDDDDDDEVASTSVASDPTHVRPRREIHGSVTDRDVARCPLDQLRDLVEEYHDAFDGGAAALALKKMATNGMFLVDSTDRDRRVVTHTEDEEEHSGERADDGPSSAGRKSTPGGMFAPSRGVRAGINTNTRVHPSVDLLLSAVTRTACTMGPREATRCMYALMVMNVARGRPASDALVTALDARLGECAPEMHGKHAAVALFSSAKLRREMRDAEVARTREDAEVGGSNPGGGGGWTFTKNQFITSAARGAQTSMRASDAALVDAVARTAGDDMSADDLAKAMRGVAIWIDTLGRKVGRLTRAVDAINVGLVRRLVDEAEVGGSNPDGIDDVWDASDPQEGRAVLTPHAAMSILSSHRVLARHSAGRANPQVVAALTSALDVVLDAIADGDDKIGAGLFLTAVNALAKARKAAGLEQRIPAELKAKIDKCVEHFCEKKDVEAWFPGSAILALAALAQTQTSSAVPWEVTGSLTGALERCLERFEKRFTRGDAVATIFAYDAAMTRLDPNLVRAPPVVDRMRVTLDETLTRMPPARAARLLDKQCKTSMEGFGKEAKRMKSPAHLVMSPAHLASAFRSACVGAGELDGSQLASLARAAAWFYGAHGDDARGDDATPSPRSSPLTPPTDEMIAGLDEAAGSLARSGTLPAGTAAVLLRCFCELRGVGWKKGDPTDGGVFKVSNHALRDLLSAAEDGIPEFESVAMDGFTRAVRMLDGFNGDAVVGERVKSRVEARMAELLRTRRLFTDSPKSKEAYYFGRGGVLDHLTQWHETFANAPGPTHTGLMDQFRTQLSDSVSHMTREHAAEVLKLLAPSEDSKKPMNWKLMSKSSIGPLLKKALLEQHETKYPWGKWAKYEGRDLVDLTRSVANLVRNMEENHERLHPGHVAAKHPKPKERFMTPITPSMVKSLTWNIIRECKRRHRTDTPLEPGAYVEMLQSLATVGNWGRGRFFIESVAAPQSVVSRLAAKISHPESVAALTYGEVITAGRCLVALDETVTRLGGVFDKIDGVFDTSSMRKLAGALRRRTLAEDTFTTPARVFAETARISFFLDKEGPAGHPWGGDDAGDETDWTRWCERCARCVTTAADDDGGAAAAQFLRMLSHACAKSPDRLAPRVPSDVISSVSDAAAGLGLNNETLENGKKFGNPERVLLIAGALARFAASGANVPAAKLAESGAAAERALIEAAENRTFRNQKRSGGNAFSAGALATFATLRALPTSGYRLSEEARRALSEALLADAPRWVARFAHFDHLATLALGPENGSETTENGSETLETDDDAASPLASPTFPELAAVCDALRASSLSGQRLLESGTSRKLGSGPREDARHAANAAEACVRLAEAGLEGWRRGGDECGVWRNVAESVVGGEDGAAFVKSLRSASEGLTRGSTFGSPETSSSSSSTDAGLTETDAEVKRRLDLAVGRLEAAREELSVGTKGPVGGFFSSLFG